MATMATYAEVTAVPKRLKITASTINLERTGHRARRMKKEQMMPQPAKERLRREHSVAVGGWIE
jgi:hypothetical protein